MINNLWRYSWLVFILEFLKQKTHVLTHAHAHKPRPTWRICTQATSMLDRSVTHQYILSIQLGVLFSVGEILHSNCVSSNQQTTLTNAFNNQNHQSHCDSFDKPKICLLLRNSISEHYMTLHRQNNSYMFLRKAKTSYHSVISFMFSSWQQQQQ